MAKSLFFRSSKMILSVGTIFLSATTPLGFPGADLLAKEAIENAPQDFTSVAKKAIPAVISIKVKEITKNRAGIGDVWGSEDNDSTDLFDDDFFQRFFGLPQRKGRQSQEQPMIGQASGFIVSSDGTILTNNHVVKDTSEILVTLNDGREFTAKIVGQDPNTDIAVLKIEAKDLPYLDLGNSDHLEVGQRVAAIGNPLGLQATLTSGVVSATGRNNLDLSRWEDYIQTDAAINRGNSGGPLLNLNSQVIGMNTAIVTNMGTGGYMGIGFAIPSNMLKHVMEELIATGTVSRGFLGVALQQMDTNLAKAFHLAKVEGALVANVSKGSPAEKSGLKQGDIILQYNKQSFNNIAGLRNAISMMKPNNRVILAVLRDGKTLDIPVDIGAYPKEEEKFAVSESVKKNKYGFSVQNLTSELAQSLGYHDEKGVFISSVEVGSPASWAGLKKGTLILAVNQKKITSIDEFNRAIDTSEAGKPILFLIRQGDDVRFVSVQIG